MRLPRRRKRLLNAHVKLLTTNPEPDAAASSQRVRFIHLVQSEQFAEEPPRFLLAPVWCGYENVVQPFDEHGEERTHALLGLARGVGGEGYAESAAW